MGAVRKVRDKEAHSIGEPLGRPLRNPEEGLKIGAPVNVASAATGAWRRSMLQTCRGRSCATAPGQCSDFPTGSSTGPRSNCGGDFNGQRDGQAGGQWHIYGTQEWKKLFISVSQRQRTTHETADRQHSERVSAVLLIRKSSVRARRGPPGICAGQKLKILLCAPPNRPGEGQNGTFWHIAIFNP
jgi:hypothetical protein